MRQQGSSSGRLHLLCAAAVIILALPAAASAAVKTIWPGELRKFQDDYEVRQTEAYFRSLTASGVLMGATLDLPVGSVIRKIVYYHHGAGLAQTQVILYRVKMGQQEVSLPPAAISIDTSGAIIPVTAVFDPAVVVAAGYRYYVTALSANQTSFVHGIKIHYTPPAP